MQIISLSRKFGEVLGSRSMAAELREEIQKMPFPVQLDFSGVKAISYSFSEELFGKLMDERGTEVFKNDVLLKNIRKESQGILLAVMEKRKKKAS